MLFFSANVAIFIMLVANFQNLDERVQAKTRRNTQTRLWQRGPLLEAALGPKSGSNLTTATSRG